MGEINLANASGRDAVVATASVVPSMQTRWLDAQGRQASSCRIAKSTLQYDLQSLLEQHEHCELEELSQFLVDGDPEIDLENTGRFLRQTARVYVDQHGQIVRNIRFWEIIRNPDGSLRQRRPRHLADTNISTDHALRWSGKFIPKESAIRKFVFSGKAQILHVNGLTYDFLFAMAKELDERDSLMLLGAGPKSNQPLILRRGSSPYRGFLEGRVQGDKYCLLLHFSNLELKSSDEQMPEDS